MSSSTPEPAASAGPLSARKACDGDGPLIRSRATLLALLHQEAAWTLAALDGVATPATDADPRWVTDRAVYNALTDRWDQAPERGEVELWLAELETLTAADLPHGVRVQVETDAVYGWVRRGAGAAPLVVETNLGDTRWAGHRYLDIDAYFGLVRDAVNARAGRQGDVERLSDTVDTQDDHVGVTVRVLARTDHTIEALAAAAQVLAAVRAPAEAAERAAREAVRAAARALVGH